MSIAYDNKSDWWAEGATTITIPTFSISGANRLLFVTVGTSSATVALTTSVVRDNGGLNESCVEVWDVTNGQNFHSSGHYRLAPATGSYTILVTLGATQDEIGACATSWTGVDQTTPVGTPATDSENNVSRADPTLTVTGATDADVVIDGVQVYDTTIAAGAGQTERANRPIAGYVSFGCSSQLGDVAGDVMSWTGGSAFYWAAGAVAIKCAAEEVPYVGYGTPRDHSGTKPFSSIWRPARA